MKMAMMEEEKGRPTLPGLVRGMVTFQMVQEVAHRASGGDGGSQAVSREM